MSIIANTTVISNFASIGQLELLHQLFTAIHIPTEVYEEIQAGLEEGYQFYAGIDRQIFPVSAEGWIRLTSMDAEHEFSLFGRLPSRLHRGEAACLAVAKYRNWVLLTDDRAAREEAKRLDLNIAGS